jgi:translocation and assembly module TamA
VNPNTANPRDPCPNVGPPEPNEDAKVTPRYRPRGGRSLLQAGTELRWKVTDTIGVVPFFEGAGVYESTYPDFNEDMQWAAGLGFRYFTVAGPIRLDLGFPVNPRPSDDIFQVYISLGQAF